jgi:hypothetical protein
MRINPGVMQNFKESRFVKQYETLLKTVLSCFIVV